MGNATSSAHATGRAVGVACVVAVLAALFGYARPAGARSAHRTAGQTSSTASAAARDTAPTPARVETITIPAKHATIPSKWLGYDGPPRANVLLPEGYDPHKQYPLVVALHGLNCNYRWWNDTGLVHDFDHLGAIVVMPEGGSGWYTDWWNGGQRGNPSWETYELDDVLPTILARYPILPQRRYHAIVGISMGGLGAVYLAGRVPGFFGTVGTLSGFVDLRYFAAITEPGMGATAFAPLKGNLHPFAVDGPPFAPYFQGHSPAALVHNLDHTRIFESTARGVISVWGLDDIVNNSGRRTLSAGPVLESLIIYPMNIGYHQALVDAGVPSTYRVFNGGHDIPTFDAEVKAMVQWGMLHAVPTAPTTWTNKTVATTGQLWNVGYRFTQSPTKVTTFRRSGSTLAISAAGSSVTLTTTGGCTITTNTPATVALPVGSCT